MSDSFLRVSIPSNTVVNKSFRFKISATTAYTTIKTQDILIAKINCSLVTFFSIPTPPTYEPGLDYVHLPLD